MTTQMVWIDVMGVDPCYIEVHLDRLHRRVLVDDQTLGVMISSTRRAQLFDDATTENIVESLEQSSRRHFLHDVTDIGGGFENWQPVE